MSPEDYTDTQEGYDWGVRVKNDPNSDFYKMMKVWGLDRPVEQNQFGPMAPRRQFVAPKNVSGLKRADNENSGAEISPSMLQFVFSEQGPRRNDLSGSNRFTGFNWFTKMDQLQGASGHSIRAFMPPLKEKNWHVEPVVSTLMMNWYSKAKAMSGMRSFAPVGTGLNPRLEGGGGGSAPIIGDGNAHTRFAARLPGNASGKIPGADISRGLRRMPEFSDAGSENGVPGFEGDTLTSRENLAHVLDDYFNRQARLPPSGATAFDSRLTPAWVGLKLPV
jgi:hypothetical protein